MIFKKELTPAEIKALQKAIHNHFKYNVRFDRFNHQVICKSFKELNELLGLAYTSSSSCAGLWICNTTVYHDVYYQWDYNGFGMSSEGWPVAFLGRLSDESELTIHL